MKIKDAIVFLFLAVFNQIHAQEENILGTNTAQLIDSIDQRINYAVIRRANSLDFFKSQLLISDPSLLSPYTSFNNSGKKNYVLNVDVNMPVGLGGRGWSIGVNQKYWMSYVEIIPAFKVRIFRNDPAWNDYSLPVRTPSYMPGISYYGASRGMWNENRPFKHFAGITVYHHSNGQDGLEVQGDTVNLYSGNFGEQMVFRVFWGGIFTKRKNKVNGILDFVEKQNNCTTENPKKWKYGRTRWTARYKEHIWYWRAGFEYHPWEKFGTNNVFKHYDIYGRHRVQLKGGFILAPFWKEYSYKSSKKWESVDKDSIYLRKELIRFVINAEYITDLKYYEGKYMSSLRKVSFWNAAKRLNIDFTAYWRIPGTPMASIFGRVSYTGSDNYNIYFQNSYFEARLGLAFSYFDFERVKENSPGMMQ
ncbi:MAG: hypothetical protein QNK23_08115 [Crocinitomicaceae bacterium]|nr:hypothetical protein [Crocinitomicaceae bacterium]